MKIHNPPTENELRLLWYKAAWVLLIRGEFSYREALRNTFRLHPPDHWKNGTRLYDDSI